MKVLIVGGGFGGLAVAQTLKNEPNVDVTVLDRRNHHLFQPLLYQVAMAGLSPAEIAVPIRGVLSSAKNIRVEMANVQKVDMKSKVVTSDVGSHNFDYLVLACGSKHSYFGHEEWEPFAPGLKTIEQATEIRRRVLLAFERAEVESDPHKQKALLTFAVVGGGPTGVELAGAIGELSRYTLSADFRNIDPNRTRIILVEGGSRILPSFMEDTSRRASRDLEKLGVQVWTNSMVTKITEEGLWVGPEFLAAKTVLWAAGVKPSSLNQYLDAEKDRQGRVVVNQDLSLPKYSHTFVIGDQAAFKDERYGILPGVAPVAIQEGRHVGKNILRELKSKSRKPFRYVNKGQLATIGRRRAVLEIGRFHASGLFAWIAWLFVHIYYLIGFKNRIFVLAEWAWHYLSYGRGARLIVHKDWHSYPTTTGPRKE